MRLLQGPLLAGFLLLTALPAIADTTYTYTGSGFTQIDSGAPFDSTSSLSGSITFASPLAPDLGNQPMPGFVLASPVSYISYSFSVTTTSGTETVTTGGKYDPIVNLATDDYGNIVAWQIDVWDSTGTVEIFFSTQTIMGMTHGNDGVMINNLYGGNSVPGTWSPTFGPGTSTTPEPSSLALLGTGFVGAVGLARRRLGKN